MSDTLIRCPWSIKTQTETIYHDEEWGVPCRDDQKQFEFLVLESAQAGLSWSTILNKRAGYKKCYHNFKPEIVAEFTEQDVESLLQDPSIVRNRKKIEASINNARCFLEIVAKYGKFSKYIWDFVDGKPICNSWKEITELPAKTQLSDLIAKDLKQKGFKFLGSTTIYAHMQATGLVNDHLTSCFRYETIKNFK
ncbi:DNA-3-methyladenine glycosylase I [Desulfovibrio litoralis]|uniref:DNA-3-methyladenine glycosylase I n=1 Tax=Desulfovibrio litoralis DSM 11393 TaxID=1121455 RepID=A0A1M7RR19_9BACT|nr:DNA-3-methyladenine glycosylase I [Desulfovibrio litoralis]SHN48611.1 DNA-3-methyladenine glycosylase I [Desulfovibrio litoralis DSM 11393]